MKKTFGILTVSIFAILLLSASFSICAADSGKFSAVITAPERASAGDVVECYIAFESDDDTRVGLFGVSVTLDYDTALLEYNAEKSACKVAPSGWTSYVQENVSSPGTVKVLSMADTAEAYMSPEKNIENVVFIVAFTVKSSEADLAEISIVKLEAINGSYEPMTGTGEGIKISVSENNVTPPETTSSNAGTTTGASSAETTSGTDKIPGSKDNKTPITVLLIAGAAVALTLTVIICLHIIKKKKR